MSGDLFVVFDDRGVVEELCIMLRYAPTKKAKMQARLEDVPLATEQILSLPAGEHAEFWTDEADLASSTPDDRRRAGHADEPLVFLS